MAEMQRHEDRHRAGTPASVRCAVLTISDTRTRDDDEGGGILKEKLGVAGHDVVVYEILRDEPALIRARLRALIEAGDVDAIVTTGGTGIAARDSTYEAVASILEKRLDGFGELFRFRSWDQVGAAAMLSRAIAGAAGGRIVIALPGSPKAIRLALDELVLPELAHMVKLAKRATGAGAELGSGAALAARTQRLADDLAMVAAGAPELLVQSPVLGLYNRLRADVADQIGETALGSVPRFAEGTTVRYAELAVLAGQLAAAVC